MMQLYLKQSCRHCYTNFEVVYTLELMTQPSECVV